MWAAVPERIEFAVPAQDADLDPFNSDHSYVLRREIVKTSDVDPHRALPGAMGAPPRFRCFGAAFRLAGSLQPYSFMAFS